VIALDEKGVHLAVGLSDGTLVVRELATGADLDCLQLDRPVTALAFAPDGRRLVSLDGNGTTVIWEVKANGKLARARTMTPEPVLVGLIPCAIFPFFVPHLAFPTIKAVAITPDGTRLGACVDSPYSPTTIALWNLADGTRSSRSFSGRRLEQYISMAFSPDGKFLAAAYRRSQFEGILLPSVDRVASPFGVLVWRLDTDRLEQDLSTELRTIASMGFSPDGKLLACSGWWGVTLYDTSTFQSHRSLLGEGTASVAFTADSSLAACAGSCLGRVQLWNHATNHVVAVLQHLNELRDFAHFSVVYSRDQNALVAASRRVVRTWFLAGRGEKLNLPGPATDILGIAWSPDGNLLASPGENNTVRICNAITGQLWKVLTNVGDGGLHPPAFSPDGRMLATVDRAGTIRVWDIESGAKVIEPADSRLGRGIFALAFSPNGQYFAAGGHNGGGVTVWRIKRCDASRGSGASLEMEVIARPSDGDRVWTLAFSPDSEWLAWVKSDGYHSSNNIVHIWDLVNSREHPFTPCRLAENLQSIAFHPVTKHLVFVADIGAVEAWNVKTSKRAFSFRGRISKEQDRLPSGPGGMIALSSDGAWLASSHGRFASVWDMASGRLLLKLPEEENSIMSLAWNPNQGLLTVAMFDGGIAVWNFAKIKSQLDEIGLGWETAATRQSTSIVEVDQ
jgi:WD40 repeat protein